MTESTFKVSSTWAPRSETAETLGQRALNTLDALSHINPDFRGWWFNDSRIRVTDMIESGVDKDTIVKMLHESRMPFEQMRGRMTEVVECGVRRNDYGEPEPAGGYWITAYNEDSDDGPSAMFSAHGGGIVDPRAGLRVAKFETRGYAPGDPAVSYPVFKAVLNTIVDTWQVDYARAYPEDLSTLWHKPHPFTFDLAWMTWLSPEFAHKVAVPDGVLTERSDDGGLLMIAAEETFDTSNPKQMAAAHSIRTALAGLNAEMEAEYQRLWPKWQPR